MASTPTIIGKYLHIGPNTGFSATSGTKPAKTQLDIQLCGYVAVSQGWVHMLFTNVGGYTDMHMRLHNTHACSRIHHIIRAFTHALMQFINCCVKNNRERDRRAQPLGYLRVGCGAASEARYRPIFSPRQYFLSPEPLQEDLHKIPAPSGRGPLLSAQDRLAICGACEYKRGPLCDVCGCVIALKARAPFAHCPLGKW